MEYLLICLVALVASGLTFFSGFGLGTILLPAFVLFFPIDIAVAMTAIVHFINNIFKIALIGKHIKRAVVLRFGLPALLAAYAGANTLAWLAHAQPLFAYEAFGRVHLITPTKLVIALLMIIFGLIEIMPKFTRMSFDDRYLTLGGILSGFFGGLSGHQGALRSAFLIKAGLSKEGFIATGVAIACMVDISRIAVYSAFFRPENLGGNLILLIAAILSAFIGASIGRQLVKKITLRGLQLIVSIMLIIIAAGLGLGMI